MHVEREGENGGEENEDTSNRFRIQSEAIKELKPLCVVLNACKTKDPLAQELIKGDDAVPVVIAIPVAPAASKVAPAPPVGGGELFVPGASVAHPRVTPHPPPETVPEKNKKYIYIYI